MIHQHQFILSPCTFAINAKMNKLNLFVTVRILLRLLSKENPRLRLQAQKALKDSYKLHQSYPEVTSLSSLIEIGLREAVGESYWNRAKAIQRRECSVSVKSVCSNKNQSVFAVSYGNNKVNLAIPFTMSAR